MIDDIRQHMRDDHEYEPAALDDDATLWKLHAHFHGERLSAVQASRFFSTTSEETHVSEQLDDESVPPLVDCPTHGEQSQRSSYPTRGSDPYDVSVLACGCHVACFGPGEPYVVLRCSENLGQYAARRLREHGVRGS